MLTSLKVLVFIIGGLFLLIGLAGMFTPEDFANGMGLTMANAEGAGTVRAMIGAHYVAMGGVCVFAMIRNIPILLLPIAAIEAVMVVARGIAAINGEFGAATLVPTTIEVLAAAILITAAMKLSNSK
ncbi:MAG: hypothetical protein GKR91_09200 [Pseudomonadales bacterium]|nr:hypothetical protein [Pseudomonadales bacterium]